MAVCNDKACEAILCGDCKDLIPSMCGDRVPNIVEGSCSAIRFEGVGDVSINQGECIDLTEGVHAYDGNGSEIEYTVTPSEIPCCGVGEYEVKYSAVGIGNKMLPSFCTNAFMLMLSDCGMDTKSVLRKIIVNAIVSPIISGIDTACIDTDTLFNPMSGVSAVDGNGNTLEVNHSGIYDQVASGSIASFESVGGNIKTLIASIEPVQSGTGTPSPNNVRPISGHDSVVVTRTGKNLIDDSKRYVGPAGTTVYVGNERNRYSIALKAGTYTVSVDFSGEQYGLYYREQNDDNNRTLWSSGTVTTRKSFTIEEDGVFCFWVYRNASAGGVDASKIISVQLELSTTATEYEPYAGQTYTTGLGRTVYGGSLDVVSGVLTVDRAMVNAKDVTWSNTGTTDIYHVFDDKVQDVNTAISNYFIPKTYTSSNRIAWIDDSISRADKLTLIDSGNVQICYELASPQTYQLTPQQVTALLGDNNVWADTGDVAVEYPIEMPDGAFTFPTDGAYEITYHAEDECGNETTETRLIVVGSENSVCKARVCCASTEEC